MTGLSDSSEKVIFPPQLKPFSLALDSFLSKLTDDSQIVIAYSGGLDSTVLLHLLSLAKPLNGRLVAHYIDHGLQAKLSKEWGEHCRQFCQRLDIPFKLSEIRIDSVNRKGVESVARRLRYQALTEGLSKSSSVLVTGHHQRDQAETVLLNLVRGAGVTGLAAMPELKIVEMSGGACQHFRPLLQIPYVLLEQYAVHFKLDWIEDPSNQSLAYRRNVVRNVVLPTLNEYWPSVESTLARTAQNMSEAQTLLDRMALSVLGDQADFSGYLDIGQLDALDWIELKNCIRYWLMKHYQLRLSGQHYEWIEQVLAKEGLSRQGRFSYQLNQGELRFFHKRLYFLSAPLRPYSFQLTELNQVLGSDGFALSSHGSVESVEVVNRPSFAFDYLVDSENIDRFNVRSICQGDDIKRKSLKTFFQQQSIPVWERSQWPVLEYNGSVVAVLGCSSCIESANNLQQASEVDGVRLSITQQGLHFLLKHDFK